MQEKTRHHDEALRRQEEQREHVAMMEVEELSQKGAEN